MGIPPGLQTIGSVVGQTAAGGVFGSSIEQKASIGIGALDFVIPGLGSALNFVLGLLSSPSPPRDPLAPLKIIQQELAAGRPFSDRAREAELKFEQRRLGIISAASTTRKVPGVGPIVNLPSRELAVILEQSQAFGALTARQILGTFNILPGPTGTFGLLPIGSLASNTFLGQFLGSDPVGPVAAAASVADLNAFLEELRAPVTGRKRGGGFISQFPGAEGFGLAGGVERLIDLRRERIVNPLPFGALLPPATELPGLASPTALPIFELGQTGGFVTAPPVSTVPIAEADTPVVGTVPPMLIPATGESDMSLSGIIGDIFGGLGTLATAVSPIATPFIQGFAQPRGGGVQASTNPFGVSQPFGVNPFAQMALQGQQTLGVPFVDLAPSGSAAFFEPFRTNAVGQQIAKPFVAVKSNGKSEWYIPAGQPTAFTKASRKRSRVRHHHHNPRHPHRRRRPR